MEDHSQKRESHGVMFQIEKRLRISYKGGEMHIIVEKNRNFLKPTANQNQGISSRKLKLEKFIIPYHKLWFISYETCIKYFQWFSFTTKGRKEEILEEDWSQAKADFKFEWGDNSNQTHHNKV